MNRRDFLQGSLVTGSVVTLTAQPARQAAMVATKSAVTGPEHTGSTVPTIKELNRRICAKWPNFTGFREHVNSIDLTGTLFLGRNRIHASRRYTEPLPNFGSNMEATEEEIVIYGADSLLGSDMDAILEVAEAKLRKAAGMPPVSAGSAKGDSHVS